MSIDQKYNVWKELYEKTASTLQDWQQVTSEAQKLIELIEN